MFPLTALLSHAELTRRRSSSVDAVEARRAPRHVRHGNLTLFPRIERAIPVVSVEDEMDQPRVIASISNVSASGVGLIVSEELPGGLEFDCEWPQGKYPVPLRFEVVFSQQVSAGMYRVGARLIIGVLPEEPASTNFVSEQSSEEVEMNESSPVEFAGGVLKFEPTFPQPTDERSFPSPAGTMRVTSAQGFDKTETLQGATTCGWDRAISIRRSGDRLWLYVHSPGKNNGWGIFVNADQFEEAFNRVQEGASTPFISSLAA
jgi:hypothetical protein